MICFISFITWSHRHNQCLFCQCSSPINILWYDAHIFVIQTDKKTHLPFTRTHNAHLYTETGIYAHIKKKTDFYLSSSTDVLLPFAFIVSVILSMSITWSNRHNQRFFCQYSSPINILWYYTQIIYLLYKHTRKDV